MKRRSIVEFEKTLLASIVEEKATLAAMNDNAAVAQRAISDQSVRVATLEGVALQLSKTEPTEEAAEIAPTE